MIVERPRIKGRAWPQAQGLPAAAPRATARTARPAARDQGPLAGGTKNLNEHLGPLRRYLDSQVGRPWDKVFSEICPHIDRTRPSRTTSATTSRSTSAAHVILIDGVPATARAAGTTAGRCTDALAALVRLPAHGAAAAGQARGRRAATAEGGKPAAYIPSATTLQCRFLDGAWHLVTLKPLPGAVHTASTTQTWTSC